MGYRWKPNAAQRKAFAERMKEPAEQAAYAARKLKKADNRRAKSQFDYQTAGGMYIPTRDQYAFAMSTLTKVTPLTPRLTDEQTQACNAVISGYVTKEKVHHDHIHIVNEMRRRAI